MRGNAPARRDPVAVQVEQAGLVVTEQAHLFYGDAEGSQRMISRYAMLAREDGWLASAGRHWYVDRDAPR